jgi:Phasin protein
MADPKKPRKGPRQTSMSPKRGVLAGTAANRVDSAPQGEDPPIAALSPQPDMKAETGTHGGGSKEQPAGPVFPRIASEDVDAVARSSVALADGVQALGRALIEYQRQSVAGGLSATRALIDARVIEVQRRFINGSVEQAVRESGTFAQLARQVANEAWAPLWPRVGVALGNFKKPAA